MNPILKGALKGLGLYAGLALLLSILSGGYFGDSIIFYSIWGIIGLPLFAFLGAFMVYIRQHESGHGRAIWVSFFVLVAWIVVMLIVNPFQ